MLSSSEVVLIFAASSSTRRVVVVVVSVEEKNKRTSPLKRGMILTVAVEVTRMGRSDDDGNDEDDVLRCHRRCRRRAVFENAPLSLVVTMDNDKAVEREEKADDTIRVVVAVDKSVVAAKHIYDIFSFIVYRTTDRPFKSIHFPAVLKETAPVV